MTFLFSDVEGSTRLLHELGTAAYADLLMRHRQIVRDAIAREGGVEVETEGDAFFVAFPTASGGVRAAVAAQDALAELPLRVRMGLHTGSPQIVERGYVGMDVHRTARIAAAGHGGQVLVSDATASLAGLDGLLDLGMHRLKDLAAAERIWQVGTRGFPPLRSLHLTNLPVAPTPFIGRSRELREVSALLTDDQTRLVTLTGPGGTGKTRLAMQAMAEVAERFPAGVWWVALDALRSHELVLSAAAAALGATGDVATHVGDRALVVAFDNFEHVMDAAPRLAELIASCPRLVLVVTSREPLRIRGEREYAVPALARSEAAQLFAADARRHGAAIAEDDPAIREVCARLDDLPLAIELAAARTKILSVAQIVSRLEQRLPLLTTGARDAPARQRTLRGAIEWSHELLGPDEQHLFARLAVFRGGWTIEAAEAVVGADLDVLHSLVEKSLVRHGGDRFSMLETIREYAAERFTEDPDASTIRARHAAFFHRLAIDQEEATLGGDPRVALDTLEADHDNLRVALDWLERADPEAAMSLAGSLYEFWCLRGYAAEGWRRLEGALLRDAGATAGRAKALNGSAHLAAKAGAPDGVVVARAQESLRLNATLGNARQAAEAHAHLGGELAEAGRLEEAIAELAEAVRGFRATGHENLELQTMRSLAWAHGLAGDRVRYREIVEDVLARATRRGITRMRFTALGALAWVATEEHRFGDALGLLREAHAVDPASLARSDVALLLTRLALLHAEAGRASVAAVLLARAEALREETGDVDPAWVVEFKDRIRAAIERSLDATEANDAAERGRMMTTADAFALGLASA